MIDIENIFNEYIANVTEARCRIKPALGMGLTDDELIGDVENNADRLFQLKVRNTQLLDDHILPYIDGVDEFTQEQLDSLFAFACKLYQPNVNFDASIAYSLHKALLSAARRRNDADMLIRELYYCGAIMFELNRVPNSIGIKLFNSNVLACFGEAALYFDHIDDFESEETRAYIIKAKSNYALGFQRLDAPGMGSLYPTNYNEILANTAYLTSMINEFNDPALRKKAPHLPWEKMLDVLHSNQTNILDLTRDPRFRSIREAAFDSAKYIYDKALLEAGSEDALPARTFYTYYALKYETDRIDVDTLLTTIIKHMKKADPADTSKNGQYHNFQMVEYATFYWANDTHEDERYRADMAMLNERARKYVAALSPEVYVHDVSYLLRISVRYNRKSPEMDDAGRTLLWHFMAFHKPTYVHSLMVAELTRALTGALIDKTPSALIGVIDTRDEGEVRAKREELLSLAYRAGLYHDIGKILLIDVVSMYGRNLTWEEFSLIRCHPYAGYITLANIDETRDIAPTALGHHAWHNGVGGYPDIYDPKKFSITPLTEVLSVADSLDAATDDIGRCYAYVKSYDTLKSELIMQSGMRYDPVVVELLNDPEIEGTIKDILSKTRRRIYIEAYSKEQ